MNLGQDITMGRVVGETVKPMRFRVGQIRGISVRISLLWIAPAGFDRGICLQNRGFLTPSR
jgi:hypothetical protein